MTMTALWIVLYLLTGFVLASLYLKLCKPSWDRKDSDTAAKFFFLVVLWLPNIITLAVIEVFQGLGLILGKFFWRWYDFLTEAKQP
jgi:hypothetical protein